jgi:spore coat protein A
MEKEEKKEGIKLTRRQLLKGAALAGIGLALPLKWGIRRAYPFSQSPTITKFSITLPGLGPTGIPLATKATTTFAGLSVDTYNLGVAEFSQQIHPDLTHPTHFWGYYDIPSGAGSQRYLGGAIVATRGTPVLLNVTNQLPNHQLIPIDLTVMAGPNGQMVGDLPLNRHATHFHGGFTPWISDGTPFQWFDPTGQKGVSFTNVPGTNPPTGTATYYYPMDQSARLVWYHDHAIGITRTNAYSGIASALIITDAFESFLISQNLLPDLVGIPLIIQDKTFLDKSKDPSYPITTALNGDLWYPHEYEVNFLLPNPGPNPSIKGRWDWGATVHQGDSSIPNSQELMPLPTLSVVPEFFADTALVNGAPYPVLNLTEGTFRFRMLNGSQARFWHLNLYEEDPSNPGEILLNSITEVPVAGPPMYQIGNEGGFLPAVAVHPNGIPLPLDDEDPTGQTALPEGPFNLLLAPAERADVLIDFTGKAGKHYILYNDAVAPFPSGDPRNDYFTGDPDFTNPANNSFMLSGGTASTVPGKGPNTRTIMKIVVGSGSNGFVLTTTKLNNLDKALNRNFTDGNPVPPQQPPLLYQSIDAATPGLVPYMGNVDRKLTLNEDFDEFGRLIQKEGTFTSKSKNNQNLDTWALPYISDPTETPMVGSTEVWQIFNLTGDTHPIHFHLVNVQIIQRQPFTGVPGTEGVDWNYEGPARPPDDNEIGWKETVRMNPEEVTTVIVKFDLPKVPFTVNPSTRDAIKGSEYVWHCHILEHEEHDMMRPLVVVGPNPLAVFPESQTHPIKSTATYTIFNGVPPYNITSDDKKFPPNPATVSASGGTFTVTIKRGVNSHNKTVTYTIKDSTGAVVTATLTITKK